jgi:tripartite-type tricarboxylate transporter receptor subunit TctC
VPEYEASGFFGYLAPVGTPPAIIKRLNEHINSALRQTEVKDKLASFGADVATGTPEQFAAIIRTELAKWTRAVKAAGIQAQ